MSRYLMVDGKRAKLTLERRREVGRRNSQIYRMRKMYHLSEGEYQEMYEKQKGLCILPSCGQPATVIDHCHAYNVTRGLMCHKHNLALGLFNDSPLLLSEAAEYLGRFYDEITTDKVGRLRTAG